MKFRCDHDVYAARVRFLRELGHTVVTAAEIGLAAADDADLLEAARSGGQKLVTRDRDFGGLVFLEGNAAGILYLRIALRPFRRSTPSCNEFSTCIPTKSWQILLWWWNRDDIGFDASVIREWANCLPASTYPNCPLAASLLGLRAYLNALFLAAAAFAARGSLGFGPLIG